MAFALLKSAALINIEPHADVVMPLTAYGQYL